jgi:hypothetical protein
MDQPNLPPHIVERVKRRWVAVLSHRATLRQEKDRVRTKDPSPDRTEQALEKGTAQGMSSSQPLCSDLV